MKNFSSIFPFTRRLGRREVTCITSGARGGGGALSSSCQGERVEFVGGSCTLIGDVLKREEQVVSIASDMSIHRMVWVLLAEESEMEDGRILNNLRQFIAVFEADDDVHDDFLDLINADELWGMRVIMRHSHKPPYPPAFTIDARIDSVKQYYDELSAAQAGILRGIAYAANRFGGEHSPRMQIVLPRKSAQELDPVRDFSIKTRPALLD